MKVYLKKKEEVRVEKANNSKVARLFIACGQLDRQMSYLFGLQKLERGHWLRMKALVKIQSGMRMLIPRRNFIYKQKCAIKIQSRMKCYL